MLTHRQYAPQARPLDLLPGAVAAYGLRRLQVDYGGPAVRVRRSSDNAEQDIYLDHSGQLNVAALLGFCGAGSGFATTWYDQTGNGRHARQSTSASQPTLVSSGALVTAPNGLPALGFSTDDFLVEANYAWHTLPAVTLVVAHTPQISSGADTSYGCLMSVCKAADGSNSFFLGGASGTISGESFTLGINTTGGSVTTRVGPSAANYVFTSGTAQVDAVQVGTSGSKLWKNEAAVTLDLANAGSSTAANYAPGQGGMNATHDLHIGVFRNTTDFFFLSSRLSEWICYPTYLGTSLLGLAVTNLRGAIRT